MSSELTTGPWPSVLESLAESFLVRHREISALGSEASPVVARRMPQRQSQGPEAPFALSNSGGRAGPT